MNRLLAALLALSVLGCSAPRLNYDTYVQAGVSSTTGNIVVVTMMTNSDTWPNSRDGASTVLEIERGKAKVAEVSSEAFPGRTYRFSGTDDDRVLRMSFSVVENGQLLFASKQAFNSGAGF